MSDPNPPLAQPEISFAELKAALEGKPSEPAPVAAPEPAPSEPAAVEPAPVAEVAEQPETDQEPVQEQEPEETDPANKRKAGLEKRFSKLTAQRDAAQERADRLERELAEAKKPQPGPIPAAPAQAETPTGKPIAPTEPDPDNFQGTFEELQAAQKKFRKDILDYTEKLTDWKIEQRDAIKRAKEAETAYAAEAQKIGQTWEQRKAKLAESKPEIEEAIEEVGVVITPAIGQMVMANEKGPEIVLYIHEHPEIKTQLQSVMGNPIQAAAIIGRVEAQLVSTKAPEPKPAPKPLPKPPVVVGHPATPAAVDLQTAEFSQAKKEYERLGLKF